MRIVIFGLSITSSWGNGHATTFRALTQALAARGHEVLFFEKDTEWYASNRDLPEPPFCEVRIFQTWDDVLPQARRALHNCDVAMVGSYFPDGVRAIDEMLRSTAPVKTFYDIDTPITVETLRSRDRADYLLTEQIPELDLYFSFTGGPMLREIESRFGAKRGVPLYCSFDPDRHRSWRLNKRYQCDLSYMGTYAADRQAKIEEMLCGPARRLPDRRFLVAGPQYPPSVRWPVNVRHIRHLNPHRHASFYSSSRLTLNVTRDLMVEAGYSPSVRLFEAAGCGATIISDTWPGLDRFFTPGKEILLPRNADDVVGYLTGMDDAELREIGRRGQERVMAEHTAQKRAEEFEEYVRAASVPEPRTALPAQGGAAVTLASRK